MNDLLLKLKKDTEQKVRQIQSAEKDTLKRAYAVALALAVAKSQVKAFVIMYEFPDGQRKSTFLNM